MRPVSDCKYLSCSRPFWYIVYAQVFTENTPSQRKNFPYSPQLVLMLMVHEALVNKKTKRKDNTATESSLLAVKSEEAHDVVRIDRGTILQKMSRAPVLAIAKANGVVEVDLYTPPGKTSCVWRLEEFWRYSLSDCSEFCLQMRRVSPSS